MEKYRDIRGLIEQLIANIIILAIKQHF